MWKEIIRLLVISNTKFEKIKKHIKAIIIKSIVAYTLLLIGLFLIAIGVSQFIYIYLRFPPGTTYTLTGILFLVVSYILLKL